MQEIAKERKQLGFFNLVDTLAFLFIVVLLSALLFAAYWPPHLKEHKEVLFQVSFLDVPYPIAKEVFAPGNSFTPTYAKQDKAVIVETDFYLPEYFDPANPAKVDALVTVNGSLEIDVDGQYLFNGYDIAAGNTMNFQINGSYFTGIIERIDYQHSIELKNVTFLISPIFNLTLSDFLPLTTIDFEIIGTPVKLLEQRVPINASESYLLQYNVVYLVHTDNYNNISYLNNIPLLPNTQFYLQTINETIKAPIVEVSS